MYAITGGTTNANCIRMLQDVPAIGLSYALPLDRLRQWIGGERQSYGSLFSWKVSGGSAGGASRGRTGTTSNNSSGSSRCGADRGATNRSEKTAPINRPMPSVMKIVCKTPMVLT